MRHGFIDRVLWSVCREPSTEQKAAPWEVGCDQVSAWALSFPTLSFLPLLETASVERQARVVGSSHSWPVSLCPELHSSESCVCFLVMLW